MRTRLIKLRRGKLYMLRLLLCALENYSEALIIFKFGVVKGAKATIKELKPVICHELNDWVFRALILELRGLPMILDRDSLWIPM